MKNFFIMTETQSVSSDIGLKFIVEKYSLTIQYDNGMSIQFCHTTFPSDISNNEYCSKISNFMTIKNFVDKFCSCNLQELQDIKMNYFWNISNGRSGFIVENGKFYMCDGVTDCGDFKINFPITEQFHPSLVKMLKDVCNIWTGYEDSNSDDE